MPTNKKEKQKNAFNDLFSVTSKDSIPSPIIEETRKEHIEEKKEIEHKNNTTTKRRTFNLPTDILEDMEKVLYIDRDIKNNTELLIKALRTYLDSNTCKEQIKEYNLLKGGENND